MQLPPKFSTKGETHVCRLHKYLHGLKQASRNWFTRLSHDLKDAGYQ